MARLYDLVRVQDDKLRPAFFFALRNTLVAQDLEQASRIAYGHGGRWARVVTLQVSEVPVQWRARCPRSSSHLMVSGSAHTPRAGRAAGHDASSSQLSPSAWQGEMMNESGTMTGGGHKPKGGRLCLGSARPRAVDAKAAATELARATQQMEAGQQVCWLLMLARRGPVRAALLDAADMSHAPAAASQAAPCGTMLLLCRSWAGQRRTMQKRPPASRPVQPRSDRQRLHCQRPSWTAGPASRHLKMRSSVLPRCRAPAG